VWLVGGGRARWDFFDGVAVGERRVLRNEEDDEDGEEGEGGLGRAPLLLLLVAGLEEGEELTVRAARWRRRRYSISGR
jgi:hypothetical protein